MFTEVPFRPSQKSGPLLKEVPSSYHRYFSGQKGRGKRVSLPGTRPFQHKRGGHQKTSSVQLFDFMSKPSRLGAPPFVVKTEVSLSGCSVFILNTKTRHDFLPTRHPKFPGSRVVQVPIDPRRVRNRQPPWTVNFFHDQVLTRPVYDFLLIMDEIGVVLCR